MQTYVRNRNFSERDYVLLSGTKFSEDVLSTYVLAYLSSTSATHLDILRFTLTIQPMNFECCAVVIVEMFSSRNTA